MLFVWMLQEESSEYHIEKPLYYRHTNASHTLCTSCPKFHILKWYNPICDIKNL